MERYSESMKELHAIVCGRVQFVMFRDFVQRRAHRLGLVGFVQNLSDGTVKVVAQGKEPALEKLITALKQGSLLSRVDLVDVSWHEPTQNVKGFRIVY